MDWSDPQTYVILSGAAVAIASALNTVVPTTNWFGKIINAIALGFGKARPDPMKQ
jgi:hypothetical protein